MTRREGEEEEQELKCSLRLPHPQFALPNRIFKDIASISAMGTEVLRPQDCLLRHPKPFRQTRKPSSKRIVSRRGECLQGSKARKREITAASVVSECVPRRLARDVASREVRVKTVSALPQDVYAGSACSLSPSPRALPLPRFSMRTEESTAAAASVDPFATRDLRRLLRLE
ncbi:uncharacterized protein LOC141824024 [Curcuma longa]|uniref:uncharacterized protein LOC141824024 n=1 Tax=Curcuma longa TaxID=136217 RepID=UPI003D9EB4D3